METIIGTCKEIIKWCNENEGFISAILTIMTILISIIAIYFSNQIGKIPYRKKMKVIPAYYEEEDNPIIEITLVNYGMMTLIISHISIFDSKKSHVGGTTMMKPIVIEPSKYMIFKLQIKDHNGIIVENAINLNKKMTIEVHEYDGKIHKFNEGFPVG